MGRGMGVGGGEGECIETFVRTQKYSICARHLVVCDSIIRQKKHQTFTRYVFCVALIFVVVQNPKLHICGDYLWHACVDGSC